jgi:hypothetical protein
VDLSETGRGTPGIDQAWLASLPCDEHAVDASAESIGFTAFLIPSPPDRVRFLVGPLLVEFAAKDVIDVDEMMLPDQPQPSAAVAVAVVLRVGAPLLALRPAETLPLAVLEGPMPFSLATRPTALMLPPSPRYTATLKEYLRRHGLEPG